MMTISSHVIPIELMEILDRINNNIVEVKQRLSRIEGQDHGDSIRSLRNEVEKERDERISIQIELASVKQKLAPIVIAISMVAAVAIQMIGEALHR